LETAQTNESKNQWIVHNKADLVPCCGAGTADIFVVSGKTGEGVDRLVTALAAYAGAFLTRGEPAMITRERHRIALQQTADSLRRALDARKEELIAEELRLAARALGRLTGRVDVEDVLDVIFRDFCIGK
jgi:tRNA modification GTPase